MNKILVTVTGLWSTEPVAVMTALIVILNVVVAAAHGSLSWATAVQDVVAALSGLLVRQTVTAPANVPVVKPLADPPADGPVPNFP